MATLDERFEAAATQAQEASEIGKQWANGDATTTITTNSGPLPSIAKFLADKDAEFGTPTTAPTPDTTAKRLPDGRLKAAVATEADDNVVLGQIATVATSGSYNDLINKPDLSALNDIDVYGSLSLFPTTGVSDRVYIAEDTGFIYRWDGTSYIQMTGQTAVWGQISGTLSNQTDLQSTLNLKADTSSLAPVATSGLASDISYNATTVSAALDSKFDSTTGKATQAAAEAGTDDTQWMSPLKAKQSIESSAYIIDGDRRAVERSSGGKLTVLYDDLGNPSLHHIVPKFRYEDLGFDTELGTGVATAFLVNGVEKSEIFVGAHLGSMVNGRLCSIPRVDPAASMDWDAFKSACEAKGAGWHMMTGHEWAAIAFWCKANGYQPRGNTNYGRAHDRTLEMGIRQDGGIAGDGAGTARTLTGSGPNQWGHNADPNGIFDLVGNVWEWNDCFKTVDGRIFAAPDNDWTLAEASWTDTGVDITSANPWTSSAVAGTQLTDRLMATYAGIALQGRLLVNTTGERMPLRGGDWGNGSAAGLGALNLTGARSLTGMLFGARLVFVNP